MLQALLAIIGGLAIAASIGAKFARFARFAGPRPRSGKHGAGGGAPRWRQARQVRAHALPVWRRTSGALARQRFNCDRSRTAPRSADVVSAA